MILGAPVDSAKQAKPGTENGYAPPAKTVGYSGAYADKYAEECYNSADHDTADLCAQWRAAIAAEKAAGAANLGVLLALISTVLLVVTLGLTARQLRITQKDRDEARSEGAKLARDTATALAHGRSSADAAIRAADAGSRTADVAQASLRADRAWMSYEGLEKGNISSATWENGGKLIPLNDALSFAINWKNVGRTPAIKSTCSTEYEIIPKGSPIPTFGIPSPAGKISIPPNGTASTDRMVFTDDQTAAFRRGTHQLVLYSRFEYFDVFSSPSDPAEKRITEICLILSHQGGTMTGKDGTVEAINYGAVDTYNQMT